MQVLRHTPGFVEHLLSLAKEVKITDKEKALLAELEDEEEDDPILSWKLVIHLQEVCYSVT